MRAYVSRSRTAIAFAVIALGLVIGGQYLTAMATATAAEPAIRIPADQAAGSGAGQLIPTRSLLDVLLAGGPLLLPIVACSFVLLLVVFERAVSLRRGRVLPRPFVKRFLHQLREGQLDQAAALKRCEESPSHVARVFAAAVRKWGRSAVEVEQAILDEGERVGNDLRRYLRVINGVATVSPLLGLLGTVWGMMVAFNAIATADAMGRPGLLAAGISQALVTTAAGLFVAIPALIAYLFFAGRIDCLIMNIDRYGQELVGLIAGEAAARNKTSRSKIALRKAA